MNGTLINLGSIPVIGAWIASIEIRLRGKVSRKEFELFVGQSVTQGTRLESHIWDIMKAQGVKPTIEPPDEIKNSNNRKEA